MNTTQTITNKQAKIKRDLKKRLNSIARRQARHDKRARQQHFCTANVAA